MPRAHIDSTGQVTLTDPGSPEEAAAAKEGLRRLISALAIMALNRVEAEARAGPDIDEIDTGVHSGV